MSNKLLVEKYKPKNLNEIIGNESILELLKNLDNSFPHLLLCGPPGTGKTTIGKILSKKFNKILELNASDERGIDTIRTRIKNFTQLSEESKLIILDECDNLTIIAQQALRRLMEYKNIKFILICNLINKIIEPIQSRTAILQFEKIPISSFKTLLSDICKQENIKLTNSGLDTLIELSNGDFRNCLNILQGILYLDILIDDNFLYSINGIPNKILLLKIYQNIKNKDEKNIMINVEELLEYKYEYSDIINGFFNLAKDENNYEYLKIIGEYQYILSDNLFSKIQFYSMIGELLNIN